MNAKQIFARVLSSENPVRIKLLGDSITHGVGGTGFDQNGVKTVANFSRNPDGYCWAKLLKEYLEEKYNCQVVNNACTGTKIEFVLQHFDTLVDTEDDLVLCTIGTNNRHKFFHEGEKPSKEEHMAEFYKNILALYNRFEKADKTVVFMANIPASRQNEEDGPNYWRIFHMNDVRDLYKKASEECGFALISMYDLFSDYCKENNVTVDSLLKDGLHPNDRGYDVMFRLLREELEL